MPSSRHGTKAYSSALTGAFASNIPEMVPVGTQDDGGVDVSDTYVAIHPAKPATEREAGYVDYSIST